MARAFTPHEYEAMTDAWLSESNYEAVAKSVGCSSDVAKRMVEEGNSVYPPIRERAQAVINRVLLSEDNKRAKEIELAKQAARKMLSDSTQALRKVRFEPRGTVNADGTINVDERGYSRLVNIMRNVVEMGERLHATKAPEAPTVNAHQTNVHVNVDNRNVQNDEACASFRSFMKKHSDVYATYAGTKEEGRIVAALAAEARRRIGESET